MQELQERSSAYIAGVALNWLQLDRRARLVVRADMRVDWANREASALFDRRLGIGIHDGVLLFSSPDSDRAFRAFITAPEASRHCLALPTDDRAQWLLFDAYILAPNGQALTGIEVRLDDLGVRGHHDLGVVFGLTPAEHRIALNLLDGINVTAIAARLGVGVGTVRTHVRRIYQKIDVGSREELLCALRPYCIL